MDKIIRELTFTDRLSDNWLFKRYYYSGGNSRYFTFQLALNLLAQKVKNPLIIETGCQRQKEDVGAGMSTSIFGEFVTRYGGKVIAVDLIPKHLEVCKQCTLEYSSNIEYVLSDSVAWLKNIRDIEADLLYLDSLDYPLSPDGLRSINPAEEKASQEHCLNEFLAAVESGVVGTNTIILIDDNQLPGGGKPRLLKNYLCEAGWICLIDFQQSLWIRGE